MAVRFLRYLCFIEVGNPQISVNPKDSMVDLHLVLVGISGVLLNSIVSIVNMGCFSHLLGNLRIAFGNLNLGLSNLTWGFSPLRMSRSNFLAPQILRPMKYFHPENKKSVLLGRPHEAGETNGGGRFF